MIILNCQKKINVRLLKVKKWENVLIVEKA